MLTNEQRFVISLLQMSFSVSEVPIASEDLDVALVSRYISHGGILPTVFSASIGFPEIKHSLETKYYASIKQIVNQVHEGSRAIVALNDGQMRCVPMKGWEIRKLYPSSMMRQMTDLDLLVRPYEFTRVRDAMADLGFIPMGDESADKHDVYFKGAVTVEVHKRIRDDVGTVRAWEETMWDRARECCDGTWRMTKEDVYIAHFEHMCHDFRNGWFGLRRVVDAWLLDRRQDDMDMNYVTRQFEAMGLLRFRDRMCLLGRQMMGEEPMDTDAELLLQHAFDCGIYGNGKSYRAGRIISLTGGKGGLVGGKARSLVAHVFLPYRRMKAQYPVLRSWPALLPACWVHRIVHYLKSGQLNAYRQIMDYSDVSEDDLEETRRLFDLAGCLDD